MKRSVLFLNLILLAGILSAQYAVTLEEVDLPGTPAIQSYAFAQHDGQVLLVGGRIDGLHKRQPFAAFHPDQNNRFLWVLDIGRKKVWKRSLAGLPPTVQEQLQSTNMEFAQVGEDLYLVGGYAYSAAAETHRTYPYLTVISVPEVIRAVVKGKDPARHIMQVRDERMAVTGGRMEVMDGLFYLAGGQRFDGPYNPMGPDHGPGFTQQYTNEVRRFRVVKDGGEIRISDYEAWHDDLNLHRRDYNMVPQIFPDGTPGYTMFSGVFQHNEDIPFLNSVDITSAGYAVNYDFGQYLTQYHSATLPVYDANENVMTTLFFGGISQFYLDAGGRLIRDMDVPFVRTISMITRNAQGAMQETSLDNKLPAFLGAGAEIVLHPEVPVDGHGIIKGEQLPQEPTLVSYLVGGIRSTQRNVFWLNGDGLSAASNTIYAVYLSGATGEASVLVDGSNPLSLAVVDSDSDSILGVQFTVHVAGPVYFTFQDAEGRIVHTESAEISEAGTYEVELSTDELGSGTYELQISAGSFVRSVGIER